MTEKELKQILRKDYNFENNWKPIFKLLFKNVQYFSTPSNPFFEEKKVKDGKQIGTVKLDDNKQLAIFEVQVDDSIRIDQNRKGLRDIAAKHIDQNITHGALVFFYSKNQKDYRFSFIAKWSEIDLETGEFIKGETKPKRYTYLLGSYESCTTPAKRLLELAAKKETGKKIDINLLKDVFSVEPLKKDFFKSYKAHYEKFWQYIANPENGYRDILLDTTKDDIAKQEKPIRDFAKKLLGRIVFLHFLQKKGWLGCPPNTEKWENGEKQFLQLLFKNFENKDKFNSQCLTKLFFNTLNRKRENDLFEIEGLQGTLNGSRVPYLNGGLFDADKPEETLNIDFPAEYFESLLEFFSQYNFTIDENSPDDHEVGIDPEMLGHIFENLLEENREKGAFYTPKEIVQYMCKESVIQYLKNYFPEEAGIENFIRNNSVSEYLAERDNALLLDQKLNAVKVCDPAIGSGAFPIGILNEIFEAKKFIYPHLRTNKEFNPAKVKKNIIQNSIYGVDIEKGAVDIAQLRFWLALVVDETEPQPLPNLDYKIMQGNSLLESYEGIDLSNVVLFDEPKVTVVEPSMFKEQEQEYGFSQKHKNDIKQLIKDYFKVEDKEEKTRIHKAIDRIVLDHIDKSLEFYENKLMIEIATYEEKLNSKLEQLNQKQKEEYIAKCKEAKEINKRKKLLINKTQARKKLLDFEKTDERPYFLWHLYFMDVFELGGFDIVIGNPPYIQLQKAFNEKQKYADLYKNENYKTFERTGDIYALFYEKGIDILNKNGSLCYITSNKWMRANYGKSLRKFFSENNPLKLIDLGPGIFEAATVDTNILLIVKTQDIASQLKDIASQLKALTLTDKNKLNNLSDKDFTILSDLSEQSWVILTPQEQIIKQQIEKVGTPLKDWDININYGIKTGFNEAFIIDGKTKDELIAKDPKSAEIIKPILRGRDIKRYKAEFADLWLIATFPALNLNIDEYPAVKEYLQSFGKRLHQTGETFLDENGNKIKSRKRTGNKWFETQDQIAYYQEFEKDKIVYNDISQQLAFSLCKKGMYFNNTVYFITNSIYNKYLVSLLNTKTIDWYYKRISAQLGENAVRLFSIYVQNLPILKISVTRQKPFETLVDYILYLKDPTIGNLTERADNEHIALFFEDVIDGCVFELYFENHMKEREIGILKYVEEDINQVMQSREFEQLADTEKEEVIEKLHKKWTAPDSIVRNRIKLMPIKSPDIIKPILES